MSCLMWQKGATDCAPQMRTQAGPCNVVKKSPSTGWPDTLFLPGGRLQLLPFLLHLAQAGGSVTLHLVHGMLN